MKYLPLIWRNLLRRPARTVLTASGVALGVGLIVALLSLATGVERTARSIRANSERTPTTPPIEWMKGAEPRV